MATEVMHLTMDFLIAKNLIKNKNTFKELLHRMWFAKYPRSHRSNISGSCAFEHIFLGIILFWIMHPTRQMGALSKRDKLFFVTNHSHLGCNYLLH